jgi:hypothetical protein
MVPGHSPAVVTRKNPRFLVRRRPSISSGHRQIEDEDDDDHEHEQMIPRLPRYRARRRPSISSVTGRSRTMTSTSR